MVGRLPTAMAALAVLLLIRGQGGDYALAGGVTALFTAGSALGQPLLARVVDRRGQPVVVLGSATVSAGAFVVLALAGAGHVVWSCLAAAVAGLATPPLEPCLRSLWSMVVGDGPRLQAALSLDVGVQELVFVSGPLLATAAVSLFGHAGGVYGCALLGLAGASVFGCLHAPRRWQPHPPQGAHGSPLRDGVLLRVFVVALGSGAPVGALAVEAAAYAQHHGAGWLTGVALACNAAGALVTGLLAATRPALYARLGVRAVGLWLAIGYLPLALPVPPAMWLVLATASGCALPPTLTVLFASVQRLCPPRQLTEANAWVVTSFSVGAAGATALAGVLVDSLGTVDAVPVVVLGCSAFTAATVTAAWRRSEGVSALQV